MRILVPVLLAFGLAPAGPAIAAQAKPNIVFYISDDQSQRDASAYGAPSLLRTPNISRLAEDGMTFDKAFVASPACAPSRAALVTGLMPARNGAEENHAQIKDPAMYLTKRIQAAGYAVAAFGKVVHGGSDPARGFDHHNRVPVRGNLSGAVANYYNKVADKSKPQWIMVGDDRPHVSWIANSRYRPQDVTLPPTLIDTKETREHWTRYYEDITGMDTEMGKVYDWARATFGTNFIFVYTSDHGGQWPFGKWNLYDAGIRVPLIVVAPGRVGASLRTEAMVSWIDLFPTFFEMAGIPVPQGLDGRSFRKVFTGESSAHRQYVYTTHSGDLVKNVFPIRSVRNNRFKYIRNPYPQYYHSNHSDMDRIDGAGAYWDSWDSLASRDSAAAAIRYKYYVRPGEEFYDLEADPFEQNNLIGEAMHQATVQTMSTLLTDWMKSQGDTVTLFRAPYPITGPRPANTDTIRPWQPPVGIADWRTFSSPSNRGSQRRLHKAGGSIPTNLGPTLFFRADGRLVLDSRVRTPVPALPASERDTPGGSPDP